MNPNAPNAPYHGRTGMTNQDAALMGMREMQRQGMWNSGGSLPRYGAFAYSRSTGRWGWSYQAPDQASAEAMARASCGESDAIVAGWGYNTFIALALGGTRGYGFAWDGQSQRAAQKALQECQSGGNCQVAAVIDTRRHPREQSRKRFWRRVRAVIFGVVAILFAPGALHEQMIGAHGLRGFSIAAILAGLLALHQASRAVTTTVWPAPPRRS